jgi:DNA repair exonuclease SbcCD ATPase subunit
MTIRKAELEFPEKGLVLVVGRNIASSGKMESVGSGKTALGEALSIALAGVEGRFSALGRYSYKEKGDMYVKVGAELTGKPLTIEIGHKCKELSQSGEGIRYVHGEASPVERGKPVETRNELTGIIGVTPELAQWTVFIDGDKLRFNKQSERKAVNLLMTALRQPSWDAYQKQAVAVMNDAKAKLEHAKGVHSNTQQEITDCQESLNQVTQEEKDETAALAKEEKDFKSEAKTTQDSITTHEEEIKKLQDRQKEIKKTLKELEDKSAKDFADLEKEKATHSTKVTQHQIKRTKLVEGRASIKGEWQAASKTLVDMQSEPEKCPTCGKKWDKEHSASEVKAQEKIVAEWKQKYDDETGSITTVDENISSENALIQKVDDKIRKLRTPARNSVLSQEYEQNDESISSRTTSVTGLKLRLQILKQGPDRSELQRLQTIKTERQKALTEAKNALENAAQGLVETEALVQVASYWYEAFGPTGIPNMILGEAIKPLNEIAKRISLLMTGGTIAITYETSRELSSGDTSAELVVKVDNKIGSKRAEGSSKGEAGLTNLIIAETLSEVGSVSNRIGYRWYDEILNSQDQTVRRSIMSYLRDLAQRLGILIFVVDHHQEVASYADYVLTAEKTAQGTTELYWS